MGDVCIERGVGGWAGGRRCEVVWCRAGVVGERRGTEQQLRRNDCKDLFQVMKAQFPSKIFDASRNDQACFPNSSNPNRSTHAVSIEETTTGKPRCSSTKTCCLNRGNAKSKKSARASTRASLQTELAPRTMHVRGDENPGEPQFAVYMSLGTTCRLTLTNYRLCSLVTSCTPDAVIAGLSRSSSGSSLGQWAATPRTAGAVEGP